MIRCLASGCGMNSVSYGTVIKVSYTRSAWWPGVGVTRHAELCSTLCRGNALDQGPERPTTARLKHSTAFEYPHQSAVKSYPACGRKTALAKSHADDHLGLSTDRTLAASPFEGKDLLKDTDRSAGLPAALCRCPKAARCSKSER